MCHDEKHTYHFRSYIARGSTAILEGGVLVNHLAARFTGCIYANILGSSPFCKTREPLGSAAFTQQHVKVGNSVCQSQPGTQFNVSDCTQDLPKHCVVENRNERMMVSLGLTAMLLELAAIYCTLSFVLHVPRKRE